jgi:ferredoxin
MTFNRRDFIRRSGSLVIAGAAGGSLTSLLTACSESASTSPLYGIEICPNTCTGCGTCLDSCSSSAIQLPRESSFAIDSATCVECGDCLTVCEQKAIAVATKKIELNADRCVGCGDCIDVCRNEGRAILWDRDHYQVSNSCHPGRCGRPCMTSCPENAITTEQGRAHIDRDRCTRCGRCLGVCPFVAISPAQVFLDESKCTRCGKCADVCDYHAITSHHPAVDFEPSIALDLCNQCGVCETVCTHDAILAERYQATVAAERCTGCGSCIPTCPFDAIRTL